MDQKIIELAIEALQSRKAVIEAEVEALHAQLKGGVKAKAERPAMRRRGKKSAAQRRAQSERMKLYWEKKKAEASIKAAKKPSPAKKS